MDDRDGNATGLGGIGKTELAFTFAHAFASVYPGGRFYVPCERAGSLRDAALVLGDLFRDQISDQERMHPDRYFDAIVGCLRRRLDQLGHILLVLDNVTDAALLSPERTDRLTALGPKLHLLATTRLLPSSAAGWMTLGELKPDEALELLEKHRSLADDTEREAAGRIVRRLGGFALAIELVAAWLATHSETTCQALAGGLGLEDLETMAGSEDIELRRHNHQRRLTAVLAPVLAALAAAERRALEYASLLAPDYVPLPWLRTLLTSDFPELAQSSRLSDPWSDACRRLQRLALFTPAEGQGHAPRLVRVHRLLNQAGLYWHGLSEWSRAEPLMRRALAIDEQSYGADHPTVAIGLNNLAQLLKATNRLAEAEPLMRRMVEIFLKFTRATECPHPHLQAALGNYAGLLQAMGRRAADVRRELNELLSHYGVSLD